LPWGGKALPPHSEPALLTCNRCELPVRFGWRARHFYVGSHVAYKCWYRPQTCRRLCLHPHRGGCHERHAFRALKAADHAAEANVAFSKTIDDLDGSLLAAAEEWRASSGYVIAKQESLPRAYNAAAIDFANKIQALRADAAGHPDMIALIEKVESAEAAYRQEIGDPIIRLIRDNPTSAQAAELAESDRAQNIFASLQKAANAARDEIAGRSASAQKWQDQLIGLAHMASAGGGLTTLLLAVLVGWWLTRSIARPVTEMTAVMKNLADGDVTIAVPGVGRNDEIGRIAEAVQVFKDQAIKKIQQKAQEEEDIKRWQQEDAERLAREAEAARQDQIAINNLASGLARLMDGDLTYRIDTLFAPKTEKLRSDFNSAVEKLQQTMQSLRTKIDAMHLGSGKFLPQRMIFHVAPSSRRRASKKPPQRSMRSLRP